MAQLIWDQSGSRRFETGVDRGVLYLPDGNAVPWNGITSVTDDAGDGSVEEYYLDGIKYLNRRTPSDYSGTLKAITYPDEFMVFDGTQSYDDGVYALNQPVRGTFSLCYRTMVGDDINGAQAGYKLHVLYNLTAKPDTRTYATLGSTANPEEFSWTLSGVPVAIPGMRPSVHIVLDSAKLHTGMMSAYEDTLYGTSTTPPTLPDGPTLVGMQQAAS